VGIKRVIRPEAMVSSSLLSSSSLSSSLSEDEGCRRRGRGEEVEEERKRAAEEVLAPVDQTGSRFTRCLHSAFPRDSLVKRQCKAPQHKDDAHRCERLRMPVVILLHLIGQSGHCRPALHLRLMSNDAVEPCLHRDCQSKPAASSTTNFSSLCTCRSSTNSFPSSTLICS